MQYLTYHYDYLVFSDTVLYYKFHSTTNAQPCSTIHFHFTSFRVPALSHFISHLTYISLSITLHHQIILFSHFPHQFVTKLLSHHKPIFFPSLHPHLSYHFNFILKPYSTINFSSQLISNLAPLYIFHFTS